MDEKTIETFWQSNPCGEHMVNANSKHYEDFFKAYDSFRYKKEPHILDCLKKMDVKGKRLLEIGLGQGTDSEQLIRQGALYNGLDLTDESVARVKARFKLKNLSYESVQKGSAVSIPWPDASFDVVFSHGVLHHIPDIAKAQAEIARVLKPEGRLVLMVYAKYSLNYLFSIALVRRLGLALMYAAKIQPKGIYREHLKNAKVMGLRQYLKMDEFVHHNTDGPHNPYSKVYDVKTLKKDFSHFNLVSAKKEFMHAPPLPVHGLPGASLLGWHLWATMTPR